jgi:hypothetical protein
MSRPNVTADVIDGLSFARACVLDQRAFSHGRKDYSWDKRYAAALVAIDFIVSAHKRAAKSVAKVTTKKGRKAS